MANVLYKRDLPIEVPHMRPMNKVGEITRPVGPLAPDKDTERMLEMNMPEDKPNLPIDTVDEKSKSITAIANIIKDLDKLIGEGERDWVSKAEDIGLTKKDINIITIPSEEGDLPLIEFWKQLGESLKAVKEGVLAIDKMVGQKLDKEAPAEPKPEAPPAMDISSDIDKIAKEIPEEPIL